MARYIDADEINPCEEDFETRQDFLKALDLIVEAPTADVVEVVRCVDCVYWDGYGYSGRCEASSNGLVREFANYDDFCSYGERRKADA